jgi:restriction system protein
VAIPDYQSLMKPVLQIVARDGVVSMRDLTTKLSEELALSEEDRRAVITSGMSLIANRVHWAVTYLYKAKAVDRPKRGHVEITQRGQDLLAGGGAIRNATLEQFPEYREFVAISRSKKSQATPVADVVPADESPDDLIARAESAARSVLAADLLDKVRGIEPGAFERLVLRLLGAMGYGALGHLDHSGKSGDGGIDGIISQDKLGLDRIYLQAKRYGAGNSVQAPEIRNFLGALMGNQGDRGVFLTTSTFSPGARAAAGNVPARIVLIDGEELVDLMIDHEVGVEPLRVATLHRINEDFFDDL